MVEFLRLSNAPSISSSLHRQQLRVSEIVLLLRLQLFVLGRFLKLVALGRLFVVTIPEERFGLSVLGGCLPIVSLGLQIRTCFSHGSPY